MCSWSGGVFTRANGSTEWQDDEAALIGIEAGLHDAQDNDLAGGINNCLTKDGQNAATANLPMGGFKHTNVAVASARTEYARTSQVQDSSFTWCGTSGGSANAQTLTPAPAITAYTTGSAFDFIAGFTNTAALTININGVGAISVVKGLGVALSAGDIIAQHKYRIIISSSIAYLVAADTSPLLYLDAAGSNLVSSVTKTTIMTFTIPANTLGAYRGVRATLLGFYHNGSGGAATCAITAELGSTVVITNNTSLGTMPSGMPDYFVKIVLEIFNAGTTNGQKAYLSFEKLYNGAVGIPGYDLARGTSTEDSTTNLVLKFTAQHDVNSASTYFTTERSYIEFI